VYALRLTQACEGSVIEEFEIAQITHSAGMIEDDVDYKAREKQQ